jgi:hypothetical protein
LRHSVKQQSCSVSGLEEVKEVTRIYVRDGVSEMLNFQNVKGKAKPYQVKQLLKVVEKYKLLEEENV